MASSTNRWAVPEGDPDEPRGADERSLEIDGLVKRALGAEWNRGQCAALEHDAAPIRALRAELGGVCPEAGAEVAIEGARRATTLEMAEHRHAHFVIEVGRF